MSRAVLEIVSDAMKSLGINYAFMEWKKKLEYPYFVGEYHESEPMNEDGLQEATFILTGHSKGSWDALEDAKDKIRNKFNRTSGYIASTDDGSVVAIYYADGFPVATGNAEMKRIQINLTVKEWSVN